MAIHAEFISLPNLVFKPVGNLPPVHLGPMNDDSVLGNESSRARISLRMHSSGLLVGFEVPSSRQYQPPPMLEYVMSTTPGPPPFALPEYTLALVKFVHDGVLRLM